jgi:serine protease Do
MIQQITPQLRDKLGLATDNGALVSQVTPGGPAEKAGIQRGDVIVSFDGQTIKEMNDLPFLVAKTAVGKRVPVVVLRKGEKRTLQVTIAQMKEEKEEEEKRTETGAGPDLGLGLENLSPELASKFGIPDTSGVLITRVAEGSPADEAGLRPGDVIMEMDQEQVQGVQEFNKRLAGYPRGQATLLLVNRKGNTMYVTLQVPKS